MKKRTVLMFVALLAIVGWGSVEAAEPAGSTGTEVVPVADFLATLGLDAPPPLAAATDCCSQELIFCRGDCHNAQCVWYFSCTPTATGCTATCQCNPRCTPW